MLWTDLQRSPLPWKDTQTQLTLFIHSGQSVYTEIHLQTVSQCSTTVDNMFTRRDTYRQPHNVQHDGGQSFDPWYLRLWMYLRRGETDTEAQTELIPFKDCGHCVESSHCSRTVDTVLSKRDTKFTLFTDHCISEYGLLYKEVRHTDKDRARTVQRLWTIC